MSNKKMIPPPGEKPRFYYGYVIVTAAFIILLVNFGLYFSFGVFFKPILNDFDWPRGLTSGAISLSWIIGGLMSVITGKLNDKFGPRILTTVCGTLFGTGLLLISTLTSLWQLYLYYGIMIGIGTATMIPLMSTISRWFIHKRTVMTGIMLTGSGVGSILMPLIATWLISTEGWRPTCLILGIINLVVVIIAAQFLKRDPSKIKQKLEMSIQSDAQVLTKNSAGLSIKQALHTQQFWFISAIFFCFGLSINIIMLHMVPHITDMEISAQNAANIFAAMNGVSIASRIILGRTGDKIGNKRVFVLVFAILLVSYIWLMFVRELWTLYIFAIVFGLAFGAGITQESPITANTFGLNSHGVIFGAVSIGHTLGATLGTLIPGYLFDATGSYQMPFVIGALLSISGFIMTSLLVPLKEKISKTVTPNV